MPTLDFKGKQHIYAHHLAVPYRPLVADPSRSAPPTADAARADSPRAAADGNLIIHGDNLHALKALLPRYAGRVDCIYIDPPYNTGNEGWTYNDRVNSPLMQAWFSEHSPVDNEDLERHDKWLCMMWPRLQLLKELLSDDGVIFVSIDYNEQHHLRMMMDEIFGESAYKNEFVIRRGTKNVQSQFERIDSLSIGHDSVLLYSKRADLRLPKLTHVAGEAQDGKWDTFWRSTDRPTMRYEIYGVKPESGQWRWSQNRASEAQQNYETYMRDYESEYSLDAYFGLVKQQEGRNLDFVRLGPGRTVQYYIPPRNYRILSDMWMDLRTSGKYTDFPHEKHLELLERMIRWTTTPDSIILDSFAGSGTTAHAVLALNKEDGGDRRFILVECEDYADSITAERVRRVMGGVPGARDASLREGLGGSFAYCELGDPIDEEGMLTAESLPSRSALAAYLLHVSSGLSAESAELPAEREDAPFYRSETTSYYLLYRPDREWLQGGEGMLSESAARRIRDDLAESGGGKAVVFAPGKYMGQRELTRMGITFCQLPYEIYKPPAG